MRCWTQIYTRGGTQTGYRLQGDGKEEDDIDAEMEMQKFERED